MAPTDGTLTNWEFHNYNSGGSALAAVRYAEPDIRISLRRPPLGRARIADSPRTANVFARESHMDELAHDSEWIRSSFA